MEAISLRLRLWHIQCLVKVHFWFIDSAFSLYSHMAEGEMELSGSFL